MCVCGYVGSFVCVKMRAIPSLGRVVCAITSTVCTPWCTWTWLEGTKVGRRHRAPRATWRRSGECAPYRDCCNVNQNVKHAVCESVHTLPSISLTFRVPDHTDPFENYPYCWMSSLLHEKLGSLHQGVPPVVTGTTLRMRMGPQQRRNDAHWLHGVCSWNLIRPLDFTSQPIPRDLWLSFAWISSGRPRSILLASIFGGNLWRESCSTHTHTHTHTPCSRFQNSGRALGSCIYSPKSFSHRLEHHELSNIQRE